MRDLQRARSAKFPAQDFFASPIKEKRAKRFSTLDLKNNSEQCGEIAGVLIKEKRFGRFSTLDLKNNSEQWPFAAFQKLQFLESFLDLHYAMFKIKSLRYKDLILNSTGCRKSNRLLRQPAHYRIFVAQKYAISLQSCDTASVPCIE